MATRANINLDFDVILKNYRTNQQDGPVRAHFVKWQADVKAANEKAKQDALDQGKPEPKPQAVPTSCCFQVSHALNFTAHTIPAFSWRRATARINGGNGNYLGAVDELEHYLAGRYGLTEEFAGVGDWKARIEYLKTLDTPGLIVMRDNGYGFHTEFWNGKKILQNVINDGLMSEKGVFSQPRVLFWTISQKTGETAMPDWLKGWWSVNDGEQYYYYFGESHGCYYTKIPPAGKKHPTERDKTNEATVTISDSPPQVTLAWDHYGTIEKFTRVPGGNPEAMSGTSNKYGGLTATKMQV
jgi:Type VI secretion system (T6SS), amidase effector protein 4